MSDTPVEPDELLDDPADYQDESEADTGDLPLIDDLLATQPDLSDIEFEEGEEAPEDADPDLGVGPGGTIVEPTPGPLDPVSSWSAADEDGTYEELASADEAPVDEPEDDVTVLLEINEEDENEPEDSGPQWAKYEVWGRDRDETVEWQLLSTQDYGMDAEAEIENLRTGTRMEFRVRLISTDNIASEWSTLFYYTLPSDLTPPPAPTPPTADDNAGFITHSHDGTLTGPVPEDMSHRVLYAQQMEPTVGDPQRITEWRGTGASTITTGRYLDRVLHRCWVIAVDTTGNESERSSYVEFTPSQPVDAERINEELEKINGEGGRLPELEKSLSMSLDDIYAGIAAQNGSISSVQQQVIDNASSAQEEYDRLEGVAQRALAAAGNLAKDGGFDDPSLQNWPTGSDATYWVSTGGRTSPGAYRVPASLAFNHYPRTMDYPVTPGDVYYVEAYYKTDTPGASRVGAIAQFSGPGYSSTQWFSIDRGDAVLTPGAYTRRSGYLTIPSGATHASFGPWTESGRLSDVYMDDVKVANVTENAAALQAAETARAAAEAAQVKAGQAESTAQLALNSANAKSRVYSSTSAPSGTADNGSLWYRWSSTASTRRLLGIWVRESGAWVSMGTLDATLIPILDAAVIGTGQLNSDRIGTQSLTAKHVAIGAWEDMIPDPAFDTGWWTFTSPKNVIPSYDRSGVIRGPVAQLNGTGSLMLTQRYKAIPGAKYVLQFDHERSGGFVASGHDVRINAYTSSGGYVQTIGNTVFDFAVTTWGKYELTFEVPDVAAIATWEVIWRTNAGNQTLRIANPSMRRRVGGVIIDENGIKAPQVDVVDLAANVARMNTLWGGFAGFAEAQIDNLLVNSARAKTITAPLLQSHSQSNRGWKHNPNGGSTWHDVATGQLNTEVRTDGTMFARKLEIAGDSVLSGPLKVGSSGEGGIIPAGDRTRFTGRTPATTGPTDTMAYGRTGKLTVPTSRTKLTVTYESPTPYDARVPMVSVHRETAQMTAVWAHTQARTASSFQVMVNASAGATFWIYYTAWWGDPPDSPGSVEAS